MMLGKALNKTFGDNVRVLYLDVIDDDLDDYPEIEKYLAQNEATLPLVTINGAPCPGLPLTYTAIAGEVEKVFSP